MNNVKLTMVAMSLTIIAILAGASFLEDHIRPEMIYKNGKMPSFSENQDYTRKAYPAMVRLESKDHKFFCSGTVISDDYVVTAAHCLMNDSRLRPNINKEELTIVSLPGYTSRQIGSVPAKAAALNNRADYGLIKGDFREFSKMRILHQPSAPVLLKGPLLTCGFPWGARDTCYPTGNNMRIYYDKFSLSGLLYPGMSGGPVIDLDTVAVFAVNMGVSDGSIIISSLVGIFETLGVEVTP